MRNLKRALSLALAAVMVLGMMVVGAGAVSVDDFTDKDEIKNKEAVAVLTTLNVLNGKSNGTYDPEGIVTRGEMAKMICVILNGGKDPQLGETVKNSYSDTGSHWAKAYIEFCTTKGIVAGRGNGKFDPDGTVSVAEAAKMLLVALGYNSAVEGYTGTNWQINVDAQANPKGLYDGLGTLNTSTGLTRDNAAQMCYNALDVRMVQYDYVITGTADNSISTKPQLNETKLGTLLREKFNAVKVEGVVTANEYADLGSKKTNTDYAPGVIGSALEGGKTELVITNGDDQKDYSGTKTFSIATGAEELGRTVSLYVKIESNASKAQVIGSAILSDDNKVDTDYTSDSINDVLDDNNLDLADGAKVAYNYASLAALSSAAAKADGTAGVEKIIIDNDGDGDAEYVLINTYEFGKVTKYSTADKGSVTVSLKSGSYSADKSANVVGFEDVAKDDYVLAAYIGGKLHVEKAETVTGTLGGYKNNSKNTLTTKLTVAGTDYNVSAVNAITVAGDDMYPAATLFTGADKAALDTEATFYLDRNGYIIARGQVEEAAYNYAYVIAHDKVGSTVDSRVRVALPDGTTGTYTLSDKSSVKLANITAGSVYAYSINSNKEIKLTKPNGVVNGGSAAFEKGKSTITISGAATQYATNSTVFYYVDKNGDVNVYSGRNNAPSISKSTSTAIYKNNSGTVVAVVFSGVQNKASVGSHLLVYSLGNTYSDYTNANVILNGKDATETVKIDANSKDILKADTLYTYTVNGDGYYELESVDKAGFFYTGTVNLSTSTTIVVGSTEFVVNANTVVVDNHDTSATPTASFNGNINKGDTVQVLADSDKAVMVVITKLASSSGDNNNGQIVVDPSGVTGVAMSAYDSHTNINTELKSNNVILDGTWTQTAGQSLVIPSGKTLVIKGDLDATSQSLANSGTVIVTGQYKAKANEDIIGTVQAGSLLMVQNAATTGNVTVSGNITTGANGTLTVKSGSLTVGGDVGATGTTVAIAASAPVDVRGAVSGNITANGGNVKVAKDVTGNAALTNGNLSITGGLTGNVTMTKGNLSVGKDLTATAALTVPNGYSATVGGKLAVGNNAITVYGTLDVNGTLSSGTANTVIGQTQQSGALTAGDVTAAEVVLTNGSIDTGKISGKLTVTKGDAATGDITGAVTVTTGSLTAGKLGDALTVDGAATVETGAVTGAVVVNHADAKVTVDGEAKAAVTLTNGTLTVGAVTGTLTLTKGTLTLNGAATAADIAAPADVAIHLGKAAALTLDNNQDDLDKVSGLTGVAGATIKNGTSTSKVPAGLFFTKAGVEINTLAASATYVYGTHADTGVTGFIATA